MWYFYEDGEDEEAEDQGLGGPERDWSEEDQESQDEDQNDDNNRDDNDRRRDKDKDKDKDGKEDKDGKDNSDGKDNGSDNNGEKSDASKNDNASQQPDQQMDPDKVKGDMQDASNNLDKQNANPQGQSNGSTGNTGNSGSTGNARNGGNGGSPGAGRDANVKGNSANGSTPNGGNLANKGTQEAGKETAKQASKETAKKQASKEATKQASKQVAKEAGKQAGKQVASKGIFATPVGWVILIVIVIIIVVIGTISFFMLMPGQILGKLKDFAMGFMDAIAGLFVGKQNIIYDAELAEVANYIEEMGYDLKGEGFVSTDLTNDDKKNIEKREGHETVYKKEEQELDPQQGVMRSTAAGTAGKVSYIKSDPIYKYIVSDNLCYIIRNSNSNFSDALENTDNFWSGLWAVLTFPFQAGNPDYGSGLIALFWEKGDIGEVRKKDDFVSAWNGIKDDISIDEKSKKLKITRGWTSKSYTFDLDGWTGRYGMPMEFLLSVHLATQMPDLAMEMSDAFQDTMLWLVLHEVNDASIDAGYKTDSGEYLTIDNIKKIDGWINTKRDYGYYMLFKNGLEHADDCKCCSHINPNTTLDKSEEDCETEGHKGNLTTDEDSFDLGWHDIGPSCKEHANDVKEAVKKIETDKLTTYTPYISKVTDHWFRDVYFYIGDVSSTRVITNDENYYYETGERWTVYETWQENDPEGPIPKGFSVGDYKLYEYDDGDYTLSKKTRAEVDEINQKIQDGDTSVTRLIKKPVTKLLSEIKDAEKNVSITGIDGNTWSAYEETKTESDDWINMNITSDSPDALQKFFKDGEDKLDESKAKTQDRFVYKETMQDTIKQVEDGQRKATNPKIKDMFVNKKYYKYDGTVEKANKIMEDRDNDEPNPKLQSKVSITKDSLSAFSILENMHTLDADYIYKDFKELIVELDYFDKEDLSEKMDTIMTWPVPETGTSGWPVRKYEKGETYYGTLINSKEDLKLLRAGDIEEAERKLKSLKEEATQEDAAKNTGNNNTGNNNTGNNNTGNNNTGNNNTGNNNTGNNKTSVLTTNPNKKKGLTGAVDSSKTISGNKANSVSSLVDTGYKVHKVMEGNGWDYCILNGTGCEHVNGNGCGLDNSIQEAESGHHNTCCATFVSWVFKEAGFDLSDHPNIHGAQSCYSWMEDQGFTKITSYEELEPGDVLFNDCGESASDVSDIGHVQMLGNDGEWLNAGSQNAIDSEPHAYETGFIIGMRSNLSGCSKQFEGYDPETDVVSPITGKILEYGTVNRTNEETGEEEEVGFIKIEAMNKYIYNVKDNVRESGKGYLACKSASSDYEFEKVNKGNTKALEEEGYDYFYDEYKGVIDGFVLYMEGFDVTIDDGDNSDLKKTPTYAPSMAGPTDVKKKEPVEIKEEENAIALSKKGDKDALTKLSKYQANEVPNMVDDLEEARCIWKEDAKASAIPILKVGNDWYVKEGTIIGKTCKDPEEDKKDTTTTTPTTNDDSTTEEKNNSEGNGNYIRLILRNLEDSVVEDIEDYFPIEDGKQSQSIDFEKFAYFMGCIEEGIQEEGNYYPAHDIGDGMISLSLGMTDASFDIPSDGMAPKKAVMDAYIKLLESSKEDIETKYKEQVGKDIPENVLYAVMDLRHINPACAQTLLYKLISYDKKGQQYPESEFRFGMNEGHAERSRNRYFMATKPEGSFVSCYNQQEVVFDSETPWSDFYNGGGHAKLAEESSGIFHYGDKVDLNW